MSEEVVREDKSESWSLESEKSTELKSPETCSALP